MHAGMILLVMANHGAVTMESPRSHGSIRMVYVELGEEDGCASGEKASRKLLSALRCFTDTDMAMAAPTTERNRSR